jgi:hypothetical protein
MAYIYPDPLLIPQPDPLQSEWVIIASEYEGNDDSFVVKNQWKIG